MSEIQRMDLKKVTNDSLRVESVDESRAQALESFIEASKLLVPVWDIRDYVAVNPFFGFKDKSFIETAQHLQKISGKEIMPKKDYFLKKYQSGEISESDLEVALHLYHREENGRIDQQIDTELLLGFLKKPDRDFDIIIKSVSDCYDNTNNSNVTELITNEISNWASAYFDEGLAQWKVSTKGLSFYQWWKSLAEVDHSFEKKCPGFISLVKSLSNQPEVAFQLLTDKLFSRSELNTSELTHYYYRLIYTIFGWASYIQKFEFEAKRSGNNTKLNEIGGLIDIVTIRFVYDIAFLDKISAIDLRPKDMANDLDLDLAYIWLTAAENAYRRSIQADLKNSKLSLDEQLNVDMQLAFCIDVRSEVMRRHLESISPKIQTIGFAGFFGMPVSFKGFAHHTADQNCPVLLNSAFEIGETVTDKREVLVRRRSEFADNIHFMKSVQNSANSAFSSVETIGFGYIRKMLAASLGKIRPDVDIASGGFSKVDKKLLVQDISHLNFESKINLAFGALKNMGLTKNFAKYVFFFGHGSESSNNPYASALDCGACAGHNGHANAKFLTNLLNDQSIRKALANKEVIIPDTTVFIPGWHNTTKDELIIEDFDGSIDKQNDELQTIYKVFDEASKKCRQERATKLPACDELKHEELRNEMNQKANDWSEIRPEWGLARNAAFIIGRRQLTKGINLDGRSFLHDYNPHDDADLSKLELIMTAPMIVTNWINMQYYASTVRPEKYGAGNKLLNNVVGGIGCIQGNGSDLLVGLTEQSVFSKGEYFHEPLRLQVFIEAETSAIDKIIQKHQMVRDLLVNNWLKVIAITPERKEFKLFHANSWVELPADLYN